MGRGQRRHETPITSIFTQKKITAKGNCMDLRLKSGDSETHKYKLDVTYRTNLIMVTPLNKSFFINKPLLQPPAFTHSNTSF